MSDLLLTQVAQQHAKLTLPEFLEEYNNSDLTQLGKREILLEYIWKAFLAGVKFEQERNNVPKN